ncbi:MAG: hypothetical protein Q8859_08720 [Bacteroidota bacterium]|nr:hypothetical protein [Bacteroidota bacterium]
MRKTSILIILLFVSFSSFSQIYKDPKAPVEKRVQDLVSKMTLDEKLDYIGGVDDYYVRAIPRLGIPNSEQPMDR